MGDTVHIVLYTEAVMPQTWIQKMPGSSSAVAPIMLSEDFPGFTYPPSRQIPEQSLKLGHEPFLSFNIIRPLDAIVTCDKPWRPMGFWDFEAPTFSSDNRLTEGGKVVSLTRRPPFSPQEDSWYSFLLEAEPAPGP
jgi:hypothetical protein